MLMLITNKKHMIYVLIGMIGLILFTIYIVLVAFRPQRVFWSLDEGGKFIYLQNVIRNGDPKAPIAYIGQSVDEDLRFVPLYYWKKKDNAIFSWWPTGFPLISLPLYRLFGWIGLYILPALGGALTSVLGGIMVEELKISSKNLPVLTTIIIGLTTPIAFYSTLFWEHTVSTAMLMSLILTVLLAVRSNNPIWLIFGVISGAISVFFRTESSIIVISVFISMLIYNKLWTIWLFAGTGAAYWALLIVNRALSGEMLGNQMNSVIQAPAFSGLSHDKWLFFPYILFNAPQVLAYPIPGWMLIWGFVCVIVFTLGILLKSNNLISYLSVIWILIISAFVLFQPYGYRSVHGFVLIAPHVVFLVWLYTYSDVYYRRLFRIMVVLSIILFGFVYTVKAWTAAGGLQWGPRYLLSLYPLCIIGGVLGLERIVNKASGRFWIAIYVISSLIGLGYQIRGAYSVVFTTSLFKKAQYQIERLEADALVTPCTWMPMVIPDLYWRQPVFAVHNQEHFQEWIKLAEQKGLKKAYLVDIEICLHIPLHTVSQRLLNNPSGVIAYQIEINKSANQNVQIEWR